MLATGTPRPGDYMLTELHHQPERSLIYWLQLAGRERGVPLREWAGYARWRHAAFFDTAATVLEAPGIGGVSHVVPAAWAARGTCLVVSPPLTDEQRSRAPGVGRARSGVGYSLASYASVAAYTRGVRAQRLTDFVESEGDAQCGQLTDLCESDLGLQVFADGRLHGQVMPAALARVARVRGWDTFLWTP